MRSRLHSTTGQWRDSEVLSGHKTCIRFGSLNQRSEVTLALLVIARGDEFRTVMSTRWHREHLAGRQVCTSYLCLCVCICVGERGGGPRVPPVPR